MVNDLESPWAELCTAFQRREDCIYDIIQDLWDWALQIVGQFPDLSLLPLPIYNTAVQYNTYSLVVIII